MTRMDYSSPRKNVSSTEKWSSSFQREFPHPRSDKVFSTRAVISQHSNRRFRHQTLHLHHQRRQLYKQEEEWFQNFSAVKKNFEHERQHVNNVTRAVISEPEDFERQEETVRHRNPKKLFSELQQYFSIFRFREERRIFSFSSPTVRHRRMDPRSRFHFRRQETQRFRPHLEHRNTKKDQPSQHLRCLKTAIVRSIMDFLLLFD